MPLPDLVEYDRPEEYRRHFEQYYVSAEQPLRTVDGIMVRFFSQAFDHAFYESSDSRQPRKDIFSIERARRIDWIRFALEADDVECFESFRDRKKRRLVLLAGHYLVVVQIDNEREKLGRFITAYIHSKPERLRREPRNVRVWPRKTN